MSLASPASCYTARHSFATHLLNDGYDIRAAQKLMSHLEPSPTMIHAHVLNRGAGPCEVRPIRCEAPEGPSLALGAFAC